MPLGFNHTQTEEEKNNILESTVISEMEPADNETIIEDESVMQESDEMPEDVEEEPIVEEDNSMVDTDNNGEETPTRRRRTVYLNRSDRELFRTSDRRAYNNDYFQAALDNHRMLRGDIIRTINLETVGLCAVANYSGTYIYIPYDHFIPSNKIQETSNGAPVTDDDKARSLDFYVGCECDFYIQTIDHGRVYGNRVQAMNDKWKRWYLPYPIDSETNEDDAEPQMHDPRLQVGDRVTGRVVRTGMRRITVEVFGVETAVPINDLSYMMLPAANDFFAVGVHVPVVLDDIQLHGENEAPTIHVSVREVNREALTRRIQNTYHTGKRTMGTVTTIRQNGVYGQLPDGVPFYANFFPGGQQPRVGDKVVIQIYRLTDTQVLGRIVDQQKARKKPLF